MTYLILRNSDIRLQQSRSLGISRPSISLEEKTQYTCSAQQALEIIRWDLEKTIGPDKVNEIGGKIQQAIRSRK
jgi:hypothetical protein